MQTVFHENAKVFFRNPSKKDSTFFRRDSRIFLCAAADLNCYEMKWWSKLSKSVFLYSKIAFQFGITTQLEFKKVVLSFGQKIVRKNWPALMIRDSCHTHQYAYTHTHTPTCEGRVRNKYTTTLNFNTSRSTPLTNHVRSITSWHTNVLCTIQNCLA